MPLLKIKNGIDRETDAKLIEKSLHIHQQVSSRTAVFATPRPTMTELKDAIDEFAAAVTAAQTKDIVLVGQKNVLRLGLIALVHSLGYYVLYTANGDRQIALESGFNISKNPSPNVLSKPGLPIVKTGLNKGELVVGVKQVAGARAYLHQYTDDPALKEESWMSMNCTATKCTIKGLTPGTTYYLRIGAVGSKDQLVYSDVVSQMSL